MVYGSRSNLVWTHSHYVKVRNLRDGSSGSVHLAVDLRNGSQVAMKFIPRGSSRCAADNTCINIKVPAESDLLVFCLHVWAYAVVTLGQKLGAVPVFISSASVCFAVG